MTWDAFNVSRQVVATRLVEARQRIFGRALHAEAGSVVPSPDRF
jgi:hypothetical protein